MDKLLLRRRIMNAEEAVCSYLTFTALTENSSVQLTAVGSVPALSLEYNIGGGWIPYTVGETISINAGDEMKMRGVNTSLGTTESIYNKFVITGRVEASGDITSLLNGFGGDVALKQYSFEYLFIDCTSLVTAPNLPATTLASNCYRSMFQGCTSLVTAPNLPATTLASNCYYQMFRDCTSLVTAPNLPATTLASNCYYYMFSRCTHIESHHVATLNDSLNVFQNNTACTSLTIDAETPPTIGRETITGLKSDCIIYVPAASVDAYKAKQYWSERAAYIQAEGDSQR